MKRLSLIVAVLCVAVTLAAMPHKSYAALSDYYDTVQKLYLGYYQRPADSEGLVFWAAALAEIDANHDGILTRSENIIKVCSQFAYSAEARALYNGDITTSNIATVVDSIYMGLFGRHAVPVEGELYFYVNGFNSGGETPATILWSIMNGAQGTDAQAVYNKTIAASRFTQFVDPDLDGKAPFQGKYAGLDDCDTARQWLAGVTWDASIPTEDQIRSIFPLDPLTDAPVCWQVSDDPNMIAKVVFEKMAENIYSFAGIVLNGSDLQNVIGGSALIRSNNVFMSSYEAGRNSIAMWNSESYVVLDKSSLSGAIESIGHDYNYEDHSIDTEYSTGYLVHVSCP